MLTCWTLQGFVRRWFVVFFYFVCLTHWSHFHMIISDLLTIFWNLALWSSILFLYAYCWIPFVVSLKARCDTKIAPFKLASVPRMPLNRYQNLRTHGDKKSRRKMVSIVPINLSVLRKRRWCEFEFVSYCSSSLRENVLLNCMSSSFIPLLGSPSLGAGFENLFDCLIIQNRRAMHSTGKSMDWTVNDNLVNDLFFRTTQNAEGVMCHLC